MNKKDEFKIELVSQIDEDLVERVTEKRFSLLERLHAKIKKRRIRMIGASVGAAALVACVLLLAMLLPMLSFPGGGGEGGDGSGTGSLGGLPIQPDPRQIPIYQGMSVSDMAPVVSEQAWMEGAPILLSASGDIHGARPEIDKKKPFGQTKKDVAETIKDSLNIKPTSDQRYYAGKNSDIYITVHLSNPDEFEILSFTLNGVKYSNYMFEAGSDLENLILKVNTGDHDGVVSYTIDAIKYVDGTEIKDVRMEGDRTVDVVITPENQPTAALTPVADFYSMQVSVSVTDGAGLIGTGEKEGVYAYIYDGERLIAEKKLSVGKNSVLFDGLLSNTLYEVAVVGVYDALDGNGMSLHPLAKSALYTKAYVLFDEVDLCGDTLGFSLLWDEAVTDRILTSLALYSNGEKIKDLPLDATTVGGLESEKSYSIHAIAVNGDVEEMIELFFTTGSLYPISFITNGGTEIGTKMLAAADKLPVAERAGYTFGGWYTDAKLSAANRVSAPPTEASTLYACWSEETKPGLLTYTVSANGVTVTGLSDETLQTLHVPTYIGGLSVVAIEAEAFDAVPLTRAVLGDFITTVGESAFRDCSALATVTLPTGVQSIGSSAFSGCSALSSITIPEEVTRVASSLFSGCTSLQTVILPNGITSIDAKAFFGCSVLQPPTIPASVQFIDSRAFSGCDLLPFENGILYLGDWVIAGQAQLVTANVREESKYIAARAFEDCTQLKTVTLPEGFLAIGGLAFRGCSALESITLPEGLLAIGGGAFEECSSLESITLPEGLLTIESRAFGGCSSLVSMTLPESITRLDTGVFSDAFMNGGSFTVPSDIVEAWNLQCLGNTGLEEITVLTDAPVCLGLPETVKRVTIGKKTVYAGATGSIELPEIREFFAPNTESWIAFHLWTRPISILDRATLYLNGVPLGYELVIPEGITEIPSDAFKNCDVIERIVLPSTLERVGEGAFAGCYNIVEVYNCSPLTLDPLDFGAYEDYLDGTLLGVPHIYTPSYGEPIYCITVDGYTFRLISGSYTLDACDRTENELVLPANVKGQAYKIPQDAFYGWSHLTKVTIPPNAVTHLSGFQNCTGLEEFHASTGCVIFYEALNGCTALKTVTLPSTLGSISSSFKNCTALEEVSIPRSVDWIGSDSFEGCTNLLQKEGGVTYVDQWALLFDDQSVTNVVLRNGTFGIASDFYSGDWAVSIHIAESVRVIAADAFAEQCSLIETVNGVNYVDQWAIGQSGTFQGFRNGTVGIAGHYDIHTSSSFSIPESVKSINRSAFMGCSFPEEITIPRGVDYLGEAIFSHTWHLTSLRYLGTRAEWEAIEAYFHLFKSSDIRVIHCSDGDILTVE